MSILNWFEEKKRLKLLNAPKYINSSAHSSKGLWTRCDKCGVILYIKHLKENQRVCFGCSYHLQMMSQERIENLLDKVPALLCKSKIGTKDLHVSRSSQSNSGRKKMRDINLASKTEIFSKKSPLKLSNSRTRSSSRENMISTWRPLDETVSPCDPLKFHDQKNYTDRLKDAQERTGLQDAIQTGTGMIDGIPVALAVMDFSFMGGSMGSVVGEKLTRLIEYATGEGLTLLIVSASGGARMQEGVFSLMQMAKISSALQIYQSCANLLYISILTSPTTGGVTASFAMLGDIIFAEPKALIAFAGRRVIEQTLAEDLPEDFQTSESMLHHGLVDLIVPRRFLRQALSESIRLYQNAPFKKVGIIPFGVQNPITFLIEEKVRRQWGDLRSRISCPKGAQLQGNQSSFRAQQQTRFFVEKPTLTKANSDINSLGLQASNAFSGPVGARNVYREILTSFEMMLNLFAYGKSIKSKATDYKIESKSTFLTNIETESLGAKDGLATDPLLDFGTRACKAPQLLSRKTSFFKETPHGKVLFRGKRICTPMLRFTDSINYFSKNFLPCRALRGRKGTSRATAKDVFLLPIITKKNLPLHLILEVDFGQRSFSNQTKKQNLFFTRNGTSYTNTAPAFSKAKRRALRQKRLYSYFAKDLYQNCLELTKNWKNENGNISLPLLAVQTPVQIKDLQAPVPVHSAYKSKICKQSAARQGVRANQSKHSTTELRNKIEKEKVNNVKMPLSKHIAFSLTNKRFVRVVSILFSSTSDSLSNKMVSSGPKGKTSFLNSEEFSLFAEKQSLLPCSANQRFAQNVPYEQGTGRTSKGKQKAQHLRFGSFSEFLSKPRVGNFACKSLISKKGHSPVPFTQLGAITGKKGQLETTTGHEQGYKAKGFASRVLTPRLRQEVKTRGKKDLKSYKDVFVFPPNLKTEYGNLQNKILLYKKLSICKKITSQLKQIEKNKVGLTEFFTFDRSKDTALSSQPMGSALAPSCFALQIKDLHRRLAHSLFCCTNQRLAQRTSMPLQDNQRSTATVGQQRNKVPQPFFPVWPRILKEEEVDPFTLLHHFRSFSEEFVSKQKAKRIDKKGQELLHADINFLNQAIELAATDSVEWRAFYIHQQLSENVGFFEDFLEQDSDSKLEGALLANKIKKENGNLLFYKSICRSKKTLNE